jgi:serine/threonine protein phosphatase PrpC
MARYQAFSATEVGISHTKYGKECQDYSLGQNVPKGTIAVVVVADGHGADEYFRSAKGAELAAKCARQGIADFMKYLVEKPEDSLKTPAETLSACEIESELRNRLIKDGFIRAWYREVEDDLTKNPFTEAELESAGEKYRSRYEKGESLHKAYGTTLIAAAITPKYWFGIHIGDGRLTALYADGSFDQPVPWDEKCFLHQTTSICDDDAAERARVYVSLNREQGLPVAVFLCSDGVDDNYPVEGNEQHLFKLYRTIALTFAEDGFESTCVQLKDLARSFATKGKGDDTSIAGIIDMDEIKETAQLWKEQMAEEAAAAAQASAAETPPSAAPDKPPTVETEPAQTQTAAIPDADDQKDMADTVGSSEIKEG